MTPRTVGHRYGVALWFALGLSALVLLIQLASAEPSEVDPSDPFFIAIIIGMGLSAAIALLFLVREVIRKIWLAGVEQMQSQALTEHYHFVRRLDHELKNPLTAIRAGLASLTLTLQDEQQRTIVATLAEDAERLSRLVNNLRKLAEIDFVRLDVHSLQVSALCSRVVELFEDHPLREMRNCQVQQLPPQQTMLMIRGDPDLLLLAAHNLIDNAFKYSQPGDCIKLHFRIQNQDFILEVEDSGIGIPPHEQDFVWEDLYRGSNVGSVEGSGVGLAMVRKIVDRHFGTVDLKSELSRGTSISLAIPLE